LPIAAAEIARIVDIIETEGGVRERQ